MSSNTGNRSFDRLLIVVIGGLTWMSFLGQVHLFDWDEINFAEISREMITLGDYSRAYINYELFWEKPPLFFWLQALSMKVFGIGEFAARFPNAVAGILTLLLLHRIGDRISGLSTGRLWAGLWFASLLPHLYSKSGIIDPWFNLFMFLGIWGFIRYVWAAEGRPDWKSGHPLLIAALGGVAIGLAVLTKGPVGLLLPGLTICVFALWNRLRHWRLFPGLIVWTAAALLTCGLWFGPEMARNGTWFVKEFIAYQVRLFSTEDAGHGGFPGYHFVVLLLGVFPASIFCIGFLCSRDKSGRAEEHELDLWMILLLAIVLLLFSLVQSKIVHYSSLAYFPITWLAARRLEQHFTLQKTPAGFEKIGIWLVAVLAMFASLAITFFGNSPDLLARYISDPFVQARLEMQVNWTWWAILPGFILLAGVWAYFQLSKLWRWRSAVTILLVSSALFVQSGLWFWINRIEAYSQRTPVEFFKELQGRDVYVTTVGIRSYAPFFYFRTPVPDNWTPEEAEQNAREQDNSLGRNSWSRRPSADHNWLLFSEDLDRNAWFVTREKKREFMQNSGRVRLVREEAGYLLWLREVE